MNGQFQKGQTPWNKGMKGLDIGGRETRFRPGHRSGRALDLYQPIGAERISKDGYRQRKVNDDLPLQRRWKMVHHIVWRDAGREIPLRHVVIFINGDKTDLRIENLQCISMRENMRRNSVHNLPPALKEVVDLRRWVVRKINRADKEAQA